MSIFGNSIVVSFGQRTKRIVHHPLNGTRDLKRLSGVGPKMEKTLNNAGVYHYSQIADWTETEIAYMDEVLSARGRIERDNWTSQAAEVAAAEE